MKAKIIFVVFILVVISCRKSTLFTDQPTPSNFNQVFDQFWDGINNNYVYWDIDTTNWDRIYSRYKPLFEQLDLNDPNDVQKSVAYFREMTYGLIDCHFQVAFTSPVIAGTTISPALIRKQSNANFHYPYDYSNLDIPYFDIGYLKGTDSSTVPTDPLSVLLATIHTNIIYFRCNTFSLSASYLKSTTGLKPIIDSLFNRLKNPAFKGIIFDLRNNTGGNTTDLNFLAGHLIRTPLHFGYVRSKSGSNRLDYTPWLSAYIEVQPGSSGFTYPIVVLADNYTASLAEAFAMTVHTLPNGAIVGETTWGATGPLAPNSLFNDGQFKINNFCNVSTSSLEFKYIDNKIYEGAGFPPDISVPFNYQFIDMGIDKQLETAIALFH